MWNFIDLIKFSFVQEYKKVNIGTFAAELSNFLKSKVIAVLLGNGQSNLYSSLSNKTHEQSTNQPCWPRLYNLKLSL